MTKRNDHTEYKLLSNNRSAMSRPAQRWRKSVTAMHLSTCWTNARVNRNCYGDQLQHSVLQNTSVLPIATNDSQQYSRVNALCTWYHCCW